MDQDCEKNSLQDELCFFDGAHSRVNNFVALAAWVLHPSMRMLFRLASMEVRSESHRTVEIFWDLFNLCLRQVKKDFYNEKAIDNEYKFNPKGWMVDEAGSNFKGMELVFSEEASLHKMKSCQWHFLHQAKNRAHLKGDYEEEVLQACKRLCTVTTVLQYELIMKRLYEIAAIYPKFKPFLDWWDARRFHVFAVFRGFALPGVNLAEIGNAAWKRSGKISLVEAARDDITTMLIQEHEYLNFKRQDVAGPIAKGPNDRQRAAKARKKQIQSAKELSEMLQIPAAIDAEMLEVVRPEYFKPNPKSKHKPGKKGTEGKKRKRTSEEPATLSNLVAQLEAAKGLMEKLPESTIAYVHLGQSRNHRQVRPVPSTKANPNPPMITFQQGLISRCQGCPTKITKQDPPMDMVFRLKAIRPFMNKKTGLWQDAIGNAYFHLYVTCLKAHNQNINEEDITMEDDTFLQCKNSHMEYLHHLGYLEIVVRNKTA